MVTLSPPSQANPQTRAVMEANPDLAHALSDPETLRTAMQVRGVCSLRALACWPLADVARSVLQAARNPDMMREMMRSTDRALSNIEAMPGGFNALSRMYHQVQAPLEEGVSSMAPRAAPYVTVALVMQRAGVHVSLYLLAWLSELLPSCHRRPLPPPPLQCQTRGPHPLPHPRRLQVCVYTL